MGVRVFVCVSVCLLATTVSPAKTVEPIEILFRMWSRNGSRNRVLDGGPDPARQGVLLIFEGSILAVDILKATHKGQHEATRPARHITVATCYSTRRCD